MCHGGHIKIGLIFAIQSTDRNNENLENLYMKLVSSKAFRSSIASVFVLVALSMAVSSIGMAGNEAEEGSDHQENAYNSGKTEVAQLVEISKKQLCQGYCDRGDKRSFAYYGCDEVMSCSVK
jgi:hypothetical protein